VLIAQTAAVTSTRACNYDWLRVGTQVVLVLPDEQVVLGPANHAFNQAPLPLTLCQHWI
jgi:hypothetical protein